MHNFVCEKDGYEVEDTMTIAGLENIHTAHQVRGGISANNVRKIMTEVTVVKQFNIHLKLKGRI